MDFFAAADLRLRTNTSCCISGRKIFGAAKANQNVIVSLRPNIRQEGPKQDCLFYTELRFCSLKDPCEPYQASSHSTK